MDGNSYLNPTSMCEQCDKAIYNLQKDTEALSTMEEGLEKFITDDELKSEAFDALKQQINDYRVIIAAMKRANDEDIADFTRLKAVAGSEVLDGALILEQQEAALNSAHLNESIADDYAAKARTAEMSCVDLYYSWKASYYRSLAEIDYQIYQKWKEKESRYDQIEADTCGLFTETVQVREIAQNALQGISHIYRNDTYYPNENAPWRLELTKEVFRLNYKEYGQEPTFWERFMEKQKQLLDSKAAMSSDLVEFQMSGTLMALIAAVGVGMAKGKSPEAALASVFGYYVPHFVRDDSLLLCMEFLAECSYLSDKQIAEHLKQNEAVWKSDSKRYLRESEDGYYYIEYQKNMHSMLLGTKYTVEQNGCGAIATYNTMVNLNGGTSPVSFPEILSAYEKYGVVANGALGISAIAVNDYFMKNGYQTEFLSGKEITDKSLERMDEAHNAFIIMVYNDKDNMNAAVHYMSVTKEVYINGQVQYVLHNDYSANGKTQCSSIVDVIKNYWNGKGEYISVIGVGR